MRRIKTGEFLHPGVTGFEEGVHYNYSACGHTLTIAAKDPSFSEISEVQDEQSIFALEVVDEAVILLSKFGGAPWRLSDYNWWINPPVMRPDPFSDLERLRGGALSVNVCLVNASSGLVEALRSVRLSEEFSFSLLQKVELQTRCSFDPYHYLDVVDRARQKYRDGNTVPADAICLCTGDFSFDHISPGFSSVWH